jgi:hypothetical protein
LVVVVAAIDMPNKNIYPTIPFVVTLCTKDVARIRGVRLTLLCFYDQERVPILIIFVCALGGARALLAANLCPRYRDRAQMRSTPLHIVNNATALAERRSYRFIVLECRALQDKIPALPAAEVFTSFGQVTLLVSSRCNGLAGADDVGCEESCDFIPVFNRK